MIGGMISGSRRTPRRNSEVLEDRRHSPRAHRVPRLFADFQWIGDVLAHRHVGKQGVALKHHPELPLLGDQGTNRSAVQPEIARGRLHETGEHQQQRRLARSRRSEQGQELPAPDVQIDIRDRDEVSETLAQPFDPQAGGIRRLVSGCRAHAGRFRQSACAGVSAAAGPASRGPPRGRPPWLPSAR